MNAQEAGWRTYEPPHDGTRIVALGRVIITEDCFTSVEPFLEELEWRKTESGYEGWIKASMSGALSLARTLDDEVKIDYWQFHPACDWLKDEVAA